MLYGLVSFFFVLMHSPETSLMAEGWEQGQYGTGACQDMDDSNQELQEL
jgi:hypothetical protein